MFHQRFDNDILLRRHDPLVASASAYEPSAAESPLRYIAGPGIMWSLTGYIPVWG